MVVDTRNERVIPIANLREFFRDSMDDALANQRVRIDDHTAHYIVNMLTLFARSEELYERTPEGVRLRPLAAMLTDALESRTAQERNAVLQRIGDVALFITGFFADSLARRTVPVDYYIAMGGNAYGTLHESVRNTSRGRAMGQVFEELARKFQLLVRVLDEVSSTAQISSDQDLLRLYEIWLRTGSSRAAQRLRKLGVYPLEGRGGRKAN
ncbi:MAG: hypothetical protein H0W33_00645 [Gammaproteobacteria bacterium]|nr:hypothetical protein [Gammaproteobacteria bacterium]